MKEYKIGNFTSVDDCYGWAYLNDLEEGIVNDSGSWYVTVADRMLSAQDILDLLHIHSHTPEELKEIYG